jgi:hypothetical protein
VHCKSYFIWASLFIQSFRGAPRALPGNLQNFGIVLRITAEPQGLLSHFLSGKSMVGIDDKDLSMFCLCLKLVVTKIGEKTVGRRSRLFALINHCFPGWTDEDKVNLLIALMAQHKVSECGPKDLILAAIKQLDPDEQNTSFKSVKEKLEQEEITDDLKKTRKTAGEKKAAELSTPQLIKNLRPTGVLRVYLVLDKGLCAFEGYYPRGKPKASTSASWGTSRTQLEALTMVVGWLWEQHKKAGQVPWLCI